MGTSVLDTYLYHQNMKTLTLSLLCLVLLAGLASGKNHVKRSQMYRTKRDAVSFLKSKATQEDAAAAGVNAPAELEQLEENAEHVAEKMEESVDNEASTGEEDVDEENESAEEAREQKYENFEECVSECYWKDWRLDFKGVGFEERLESHHGDPDGPMEKYALFTGNPKPVLSDICLSCFDKEPADAKALREDPNEYNAKKERKQPAE